jgi:hypothetical protein
MDTLVPLVEGHTTQRMDTGVLFLVVYRTMCQHTGQLSTVDTQIWLQATSQVSAVVITTRLTVSIVWCWVVTVTRHGLTPHQYLVESTILVTVLGVALLVDITIRFMALGVLSVVATAMLHMALHLSLPGVIPTQYIHPIQVSVVAKQTVYTELTRVLVVDITILCTDIPAQFKVEPTIM